MECYREEISSNHKLSQKYAGIHHLPIAFQDPFKLVNQKPGVAGWLLNSSENGRILHAQMPIEFQMAMKEKMAP